MEDRISLIYDLISRSIKAHDAEVKNTLHDHIRALRENRSATMMNGTDEKAILAARAYLVELDGEKP